MFDIAVLEIGCWDFSVGGEHYFGSIHYRDKAGGYESARLKHPLSAKEARYLNKKNENRHFCQYKPGELSEGFETRAAVIRAGIKAYHALDPKPFALAIGGYAVADPQQILVGPQAFMYATNALWAEHERVGGYERNEKTCRRLFKEYQALLKHWEKKNG